MSDYLDEIGEDLLQEFFSEADAQVESLERNILAIEEDAKDCDAIDEIFRAAHTLKGGSATVQMNELAEFTHLVEDLLDEIRGNNIQVSEATVDTLLSAIDVIRSMLEYRKRGEVYDDDISAIKKRLCDALGVPEEKATSQTTPPVTTEDVIEEEISEEEFLEMKGIVKAGEEIYQITVQFDAANPMGSLGGMQVYTRLRDCSTILKISPDFERLYEDTFFAKVCYYVATQEEVAVLEKAATLPDLTQEVTIGGVQVALPSTGQQEIVEEAPSPIEERQAPPSQESPREKTIESKERRKAEPKTKAKTNERGEDSSGKESGGSLLRVESKRIDKLLNLVSEAVINKASLSQVSVHFNEGLLLLQRAEETYRERLSTLFARLPHYVKNCQDLEADLEVEVRNDFKDLYTVFDTFGDRLKVDIDRFKDSTAQLARNTGELHEAVLRVRMVPVSQIFSRFPRLVRDLAKRLGKKVTLTLEGEETEMDKSVREELVDPLMHCVRNSLDHGIEMPADRKQSGKPEEGSIVLKAKNEGNMVVIEITDDGAGISVGAIQKKAIERGIIHPSKKISDVEAFGLIFDSGFSTASEITDISGRGVGLDVVRQQIEKLNGTIAVWSERGEGSTFTIKLPLTLAIIQGLLVRVASEIYVLPIAAVVESQSFGKQSVRLIDNYEVIRIREEVITLVRLNKLFGFGEEEGNDDREEGGFIAIVGEGEKKIGLVVDSLLGEEDVVIKPLADQYTSSPGIAGATILGDGRVALIVDVSELLGLMTQKEYAVRVRQAVT